MLDVDTRNKILALYLIGRSDGLLPKAHMFDFFLINGILGYFDANVLLGHLIDTKLVALSLTATRTYLELTDEGRQTLDALCGSISAYAAKMAEDYFRDNALKIRNDLSVRAIADRHKSGGYEAVMTIDDGKKRLLELKMKYPDAESADKACAKWANSAADIYQNILIKLME